MSRYFWLALTATLPTLVLSTNDTTCQALNAQLPGLVTFPGTSVYSTALATYYSGQERDIRPQCIFMPTTVDEVSRFVKIIAPRKGQDAKFAIRGGGHTLWKGAANIEGGVTVDMRLMNQTVLSQDGKMAGLGPGGRFHDVYHQLSPHNLTVMGGRVPSIGVGGFLSSGKSYQCP